MKKLCHIYIFIFILDFVNVENHAYWQKLFRHKLGLQETRGTISRSATHRTLLYLSEKRGVFSKVVIGFRNFGYDF